MTAAGTGRRCNVEVASEHYVGGCSPAQVHGSVRPARRSGLPVTRTFRDKDGGARVSRATITFLFPVAGGTSDKLTLPSGQTGPILRISEGLADPSNADGGGYLTEVLLG